MTVADSERGRLPLDEASTFALSFKTVTVNYQKVSAFFLDKFTLAHRRPTLIQPPRTQEVEFSLNPWRAPQRVLLRESTNEVANFGIVPRSAWMAGF